MKILATLLVVILAWTCAADPNMEAALLVQRALASGAPTTVPADIILNPDGLAVGLVPSDSTLNKYVQAGLASQSVSAAPGGGGTGTITGMTNIVLTPPAFPESFVVDGTNFNVSSTHVIARQVFNGVNSTCPTITFTDHNIFALSFMTYTTVVTDQSTQLDSDLFTAYTDSGNAYLVSQKQNNGASGNTMNTHYQPGAGASASNPYMQATSNVWYYTVMYGDSVTGSANIATYNPTTGALLGGHDGITTTNTFHWSSMLLNNQIGSGLTITGSNYFGSVPIAFDTHATKPFGILAKDVGPLSISLTQTAYDTMTPSFPCPWAYDYSISRQTNGGSFTSIQTHYQLGTTFSDTNISDGSTIAYQVSATSLGATVGTQTTSTINVSNSLFATWAASLSEGTGTTTADTSGHGHIGTLSGATLPSWSTFGTGTNCLTFNGINDYVTFGTFTMPTTAFSFSIWVNPSALVANAVIASKGYDGVNTQWQLSVSTTGGKLFFGTFNGAQASAYGPTSNTVLTNGLWSYVVGTYDGAGTYSLYFNGQTSPDSQGSGLGPIATAERTMIGANDVSGVASAFFAGSIKDPRFYPFQMSGAQILKAFGCGPAR